MMRLSTTILYHKGTVMALAVGLVAVLMISASFASGAYAQGRYPQGVDLTQTFRQRVWYFAWPSK
jgi:hypothetical protein